MSLLLALLAIIFVIYLNTMIFNGLVMVIISAVVGIQEVIKHKKDKNV